MTSYKSERCHESNMTVGELANIIDRKHQGVYAESQDTETERQETDRLMNEIIQKQKNSYSTR
ncbi:hypothetical protein HUG15_06890 [Salicibibacter cibarius]|uniref:Uncharacterized protein n=1 Tax=Salicibibacter cibarius TaxID=2743000 RepID=A0A7T6Z2V4_9BACI|nr:hypothetical protein [Salicibibacter cibarius]QQK75341.1 hypothetical protein HUG15_06890 [Salicibibacter cibarius]